MVSGRTALSVFLGWLRFLLLCGLYCQTSFGNRMFYPSIAYFHTILVVTFNEIYYIYVYFHHVLYTGIFFRFEWYITTSSPTIYVQCFFTHNSKPYDKILYVTFVQSKFGIFCFFFIDRIWCSSPGVNKLFHTWAKFWNIKSEWKTE